MHTSSTTPQHRLLVMGSMDEFVELVKMARARGWWVAVADGYPEGPAKAFADAAYTIDARDTAAMAALAKELQVDGAIASFSDVLFESLCKLTHAAGLYSYCPLPGMATLRDKRLMGEMFAELGIPTPRTRLAHAGSVEADCAGLTWPCVMKPVAGYGSYGIFVVRCAEEVEAHFAATAGISGSDAVLVEEYDEGAEINMIAWVAAGRVHPISLADREKCPLVEGGVPDVVRIVYPSRYAEAAAGPAVEILQKVADYVGMIDGPLSMQFFWHPESGTLNVCEVAGRVLGYEHELTQIGAGFCIEDALLDLTYDRDAMRARVQAHSLTNFKGASFVLNAHALPGCTAQVASLTPIEGLLGHEGVLTPPSMIHYQVGERVGHGKGAKPYVARLFCHTQTREEADVLSAELFRAFSARGTDGEELVCRESLPFMEEWDA